MFILPSLASSPFPLEQLLRSLTAPGSGSGAVAALLSSPAMLYSFLTISRHSLHTLQVSESGENIL